MTHLLRSIRKGFAHRFRPMYPGFPVKGGEAASTLVGNEADVIWHAADLTGLGAIQGAVAGKAKAQDCYSDQPRSGKVWNDLSANGIDLLPWTIRLSRLAKKVRKKR